MCKGNSQSTQYGKVCVIVWHVRHVVSFSIVTFLALDTTMPTTSSGPRRQPHPQNWDFPLRACNMRKPRKPQLSARFSFRKSAGRQNVRTRRAPVRVAAGHECARVPKSTNFLRRLFLFFPLPAGEVSASMVASGLGIIQLSRSLRAWAHACCTR